MLNKVLTAAWNHKDARQFARIAAGSWIIASVHVVVISQEHPNWSVDLLNKLLNDVPPHCCHFKLRSWNSALLTIGLLQDPESNLRSKWFGFSFDSLGLASIPSLPLNCRCPCAHWPRTNAGAARLLGRGDLLVAAALVFLSRLSAIPKEPGPIWLCAGWTRSACDNGSISTEQAGTPQRTSIWACHSGSESRAHSRDRRQRQRHVS